MKKELQGKHWKLDLFEEQEKLSPQDVNNIIRSPVKGINTKDLEFWNCFGRLFGNTNMGEDEIHSLRAANNRLEHETQLLKLAKHKTDKELANLREQLESERQLVKKLKRERPLELRALREDETKKFEFAINDLKTRLHMEQSQSLENQKLQLERNFRSELIQLIHKKDSQLHLLFTHSQRVKREADKKRAADRKIIQDAYQIHLEKLKQDFQKQLVHLLLELKTKERHITSLRKTVQSVSNKSLGVSLISTCSSSIAAITPFGGKQHHQSRPASRNKSYRRSRISQHPYNPSSGKRRHESTLRMKEMGETQPVDSQQFFYHHHYAGSALETLPEAESEEECSETEDLSENGNPLVTSCSSQASDENFSLNHASNLEIRNVTDGQPIIPCEASVDQRNKILSLELTIRQLRDELRECKDQNELLEFRLLEIEELGGNHSSQSGTETRKCGKSSRSVRSLIATGSEVALYHGAEVPTEVTIRGDYDSSSNSHASVAESRSSCSDCSDSLSLQESGIFDSQSVNDDAYTTALTAAGFSNVPIHKEDISRELTDLTTQIENLVLRFAEGSGNTGNGESTNRESTTGGNMEPVRGLDSASSRGSGGSGPTSTARSKVKRGQDLTSELKSCRQRIQEFERRLTQFADINYVNSLEDKVSLLIQENQRLEEERSEMEEAENDSRHQCQRLEEKISHLRQKKALLQRQLSSEKLFIEQLRMKILQLQEREEDLSSQIIRVDALVQNYEQHNFELEESCIEMKCSVQFIANSVPVLVLWYLWSLLKLFQTEAITNYYYYYPPSNHLRDASLPFIQQSPSSTVTLLSRKHKLKSGETASLEPSLKKLRGESDRKDVLIQCDKSCDIIREEYIRPSQSNADSQTCEESWQCFINEIIAVQRKEWLRIEKALEERIELLECDIDKYQDIFDSERGKLINHYETKLAEQESALRESQKFLEERKNLQQKWDSLILELEQVADRAQSCISNEKDALAEGINVKKQSHGSDSSIKSPSSSSTASSRKGEGEKIKGGGLVADRIRSLFPGEWKGGRKPDVVGVTGNTIPGIAVVGEDTGNQCNKNDLVMRLEQAFQHQVTQFEQREKELRDEIDRLKEEMGAKAFTTPNIITSTPTEHLENDNSQIVYLAEENNRLQIILSDQESVMSRVKELEEENEKLTTELSANATLRKRLEDAHGSETSLRNRIEELEQSEIYVKETVDQVEKRERKCLERISQLREEIQFLRNKCCQLQDDLDSKISREAKYKNEIQTLATKVKGLMDELEEKDNLLENNATSSQSQISKLRAQLNEVHKQLADVECTNGMLREEVLYLERTLQEAIERSANTEKLVATLSQELRCQEATVGSLQKELEAHSHDYQRANPGHQAISNDLDIFAQNEGGLFGVDRDIKNIAAQIQDSRGIPELLSRCESDECLSRSSVVTPISKEMETTVSVPNECTEVAVVTQMESELEERNLMESACQGEVGESPLDGADVAETQELEFRICRRVAEDALLVSWSIPDKYSMEKVDGYEISVNGNIFLRIPKPNRFKAVLYGLNLTEPLHLSLKCTGAFKLQESTITYIA
ncbi:unnamed protein product [Allacma fusca]|uniref:Janus kinase and microtubule-interacting protein C-terminal domain-containing protein n=1 Tax=Allacma fusca TaxID=39272 RepID=A0A8J2PH56_9HEXA|nr:unnamed protein product [Allacma fusca]